MLYTFEKAELNTFFTHKDTSFPLDKQGLVLVTGENGVGKSLMFSSIPLLLQGSLPTGKIKASDSKGIDIKLYASAGKHRYSIGFYDGKYKIKKGVKKVTPYRKPDAVKFLQDVFPSESILNSTSFVSQFSPLYVSLISGMPALRMKIVESFIDQTKLNSLKEEVKSRHKDLFESDTTAETKALIASCKKQLLKLPVIKKSGKIDTLKKLKALRKKVNEKIEDLSLSLKEYNRYEKAKSKVITKKSSKSIKERISQLEAWTSDLEDTIGSIEHCKKELKLFIKFESEFYTFDTPRNIQCCELRSVIPEDKALEVISAYETNLEETKLVELDVKRILKSGRNKVCPYCFQEIKKSAILENVRALKTKLAKLKSYYEFILDDMREIATWCDVRDKITESGISSGGIKLFINNGYAMLKAKLTRFNKELVFLKDQLPYVLILESFTVKKVSENNLKKLQAEYDKVDEKIEKLYDSIAKDESIIERRNHLKQEIAEAKEQLSTSVTKDDKKYLPVLLKALTSRDFRTEIVYNFCEVLIEEWNLYASEMFQGKMKFSLGVDQGYPAFQYSANGAKPCDIRFMSGGEKKRLIVCMIPSILSLSSSLTNILIVDELDANVDDIGVEAMLNFMHYILESELGKTSIFFISPKKLYHSDYNIWNVEKINGVSNLRR